MNEIRNMIPAENKIIKTVLISLFILYYLFLTYTQNITNIKLYNFENILLRDFTNFLIK